ncbi:MAG: hypothetical protein JO052_14865 [Bradyrhizobium sp.]|nr:hypothetical protein [Bradyrhizobium sp.]
MKAMKGGRTWEHDQKSGYRFSDRIMLKQSRPSDLPVQKLLRGVCDQLRPPALAAVENEQALAAYEAVEQKSLRVRIIGFEPGGT